MSELHLINIEEGAMSVEVLQRQINLIQKAMEKNMKEGEHFGVIPGTKKPTLYKPGAEKLCLIFRLSPDYEIVEQAREREFIAYTVKCTLTHIHSNTLIASGIGACNSRETKYRYRSENTGRPVPNAYWKNRDRDLLGGSQFEARKKDGKWTVFEQIENENPWDLDNTLIKMACKRALIAATLNATAASDIFTQEAEDVIPGAENGEKPQTEAKKEPEKESPNTESRETGEPQRSFYDWMLFYMNELGAAEFNRILGASAGIQDYKKATPVQQGKILKAMKEELDKK